MAAARYYTEFPTLYDCKNRELEVGVVERLIELGGEIPPHLLKVSWAILLRSYTEEKTPIFKFNGRSVAVDVQEWDTSSVQDVTGVLGSRYTGISSLEVGVSCCRSDGTTHCPRNQDPKGSTYFSVTRKTIDSLIFVTQSASLPNRYPMWRIS